MQGAAIRAPSGSKAGPSAVVTGDFWGNRSWLQPQSQSGDAGAWSSAVASPQHACAAVGRLAAPHASALQQHDGIATAASRYAQMSVFNATTTKANSSCGACQRPTGCAPGCVAEGGNWPRVIRV